MRSCIDSKTKHKRLWVTGWSLGSGGGGWSYDTSACKRTQTNSQVLALAVNKQHDRQQLITTLNSSHNGDCLTFSVQQRHQPLNKRYVQSTCTCTLLSHCDSQRLLVSPQATANNILKYEYPCSSGLPFRMLRDPPPPLPPLSTSVWTANLGAYMYEQNNKWTGGALISEIKHGAAWRCRVTPTTTNSQFVQYVVKVYSRQPTRQLKYEG